jgi:hypothetical protein
LAVMGGVGGKYYYIPDVQGERILVRLYRRLLKRQADQQL